MTSIESRYKSQISDMQESHQTAMEDLIARNKNLENELKVLRESFEL